MRIENINGSNYFAFKNTQARANLPVENKIVVINNTVPGLRDSLNPLHSFTKVNGYNIPKYNPPEYRPLYIPDLSAEELTHEEWVESLSYEVRMYLHSQNGVPLDLDHLSDLTAEGRFYLVQGVERHAEKTKYIDAIWAEYSERGAAMGMKLMTMSASFYPNEIMTFYFDNENGGLILTRFADGRELLTNVPENLSLEEIYEVLKELGLSPFHNEPKSVSLLMKFYEDFFEEIFNRP